MLQKTSRQIRRTALCAATAFALSMPGIASAGPLGKSKNKASGAVVHATKIVKKAAKPVAKAVKKGSEQAQLPGAELLSIVQKLNIIEQVRNSVALMEQMNADYVHFSGGGFGCKGECKAFRAELKATFDDFLLLVEEVPVLNEKPGLFENISRVADLIDYVPPRALYLMWQALDARIHDLRMAAGDIRALLAALPPLAAKSACDWANSEKKPVMDLVQAELQRLAWILKTVEGLIPDIKVKAEAGGDAGTVVFNILVAGDGGFKVTDVTKTALKALAAVPESINWAIKLNIMRAQAVCAQGKKQAS